MERQKLDQSFSKIKRMEDEKVRLNNQLNKMLQSYKELESN